MSCSRRRRTGGCPGRRRSRSPRAPGHRQNATVAPRAIPDDDHRMVPAVHHRGDLEQRVLGEDTRQLRRLRALGVDGVADRHRVELRTARRRWPRRTRGRAGVVTDILRKHEARAAGCPGPPRSGSPPIGDDDSIEPELRDHPRRLRARGRRTVNHGDLLRRVGSARIRSASQTQEAARRSRTRPTVRGSLASISG